jgi:hypothetical protein
VTDNGISFSVTQGGAIASSLCGGGVYQIRVQLSSPSMVRVMHGRWAPAAPGQG